MSHARAFGRFGRCERYDCARDDGDDDDDACAALQYNTTSVVVYARNPEAPAAVYGDRDPSTQHNGKKLL